MRRAQEHSIDPAPSVLHPKRCAAKCLQAGCLPLRPWPCSRTNALLEHELCDLAAPRDDRPARFLTNTLTALPTPSCAAENSLQIAGAPREFAAMKAQLQVQQHPLPGYRLPVPGSLFAEPCVRTAARLRTKSQAVSFLRMHAVPPPLCALECPTLYLL